MLSKTILAYLAVAIASPVPYPFTHQTSTDLLETISNLTNSFPEMMLQDTSLNNTFTASEITDLTSNHESFYDEYREVKVQSRLDLSIKVLKQLYSENPKTRIQVLDSLTYVVLNQAKTDKNKFIVDEWYFKDMTAVNSFTVNIPLTARLIQTKLKGSGSVDTSLSVGVTLKGIKTKSKTYGISITFGTRWLNKQDSRIPPLGIKPAYQFTKSKSESFKIADSIGFQASCSAENGHSVTQYLRVGLTKYGNIKVRQLVFTENSNKWKAGEWESIEEDFNPTTNIACFAEEQPLNTDHEILY